MTQRALLRGLGLLVFVLMATTIAAPAEAGQRSGHHRSCITFTLDGVGQDLGGGNTEATLSLYGHPVATTAAALKVTDPVGTVASFRGPLVITPIGSSGTLIAQLVGTLDIETGVFAAHSTSVRGTGVLRGVTGTIAAQGTEDLVTGAFTETFTGTLCIANRHRSALSNSVAGR